MAVSDTVADLELGIHRRTTDQYSVELRYSRPDSESDVRPIRDAPADFEVDQMELRPHTLDPEAYGHTLSDALFADDELRSAFAEARAAAASAEMPLRVRLFVGPSAPELHSLRWETLRDPETDAPLITGEHLLFSRYLSSVDWRPVRLRPRTDLQALVVVANPNDLDEYDNLAPVDVARELERAHAGLGDIPITELASGGTATRKNIITSLRDEYDVHYLICHGALVDGEPWLWLEDKEGATHRVAGKDVVTRLRELRRRPRLVVLASCQSAGTGEEPRSQDEGALAALGPRLAEAGIPAVLAMQGNVRMSTVAAFMPVFFEELRRDGRIDRAMAAARGAARDRPDWWMPALFMRLKSGRIWYTPGFADEQYGLEKWPALLRNIQRERCTPIIGPGLTDPLLGSRREIARSWAETYQFPMAPHDREDLPQVAQFLAVNQDEMFPRDELEEHLRRELLERLDGEADRLQGASLDELIAKARAPRADDPDEPHKVLANLPLPIYVTTDPSSLLLDALRDADKEPVAELCRWNEHVEWLPSIYDDEPRYRPTVERPLVFQLFGRIDEPDSLVLTEDDYFDYLIGVTSNKDLIPAVVRRALADTALLFLGFRMDEWDFRVLFRSIMSQEGRRRRSRYAHVAAQIDPEEGRILEPQRARHYLESYFQGADISIYWGTPQDFTQELYTKIGSTKYA